MAAFIQHLCGASLLIAAVSNVASSDAAADQDLYIRDFAFVLTPGAIQEPSDKDRLADPAPHKVPLVLWTKLAGNKNGLDRLKQGGFHLRHKWTISCGNGPTDLGDNIVHEKSIDVDGRESWTLIANELEGEIYLNPDHEFDWRTASERDYVVGCFYNVEVVDEQGEPLFCRPLNGKCSISIKVAR